MYLSKIKIIGFRLFETLVLELNPGLNVLVGENDSGKSALIDAIRYVLGTNSNDRTYVQDSDFFADTDQFSIQLKFSDVGRHAHRFVEHLSHEEFEDAAGNKKLKPALFVQLHAQKTGTERRGYPYIKTDIRSGLDGNGLVIEKEIRDFLATTYLRPLRDAEAELSSGRASRLSQILASSNEVKEQGDDILRIIAATNDELLGDEKPLTQSAVKITTDYLHQLIFESDKGTLGAFIDIAGVREADLEGLPDVTKRRQLRSVLEGLSLALTQDHRRHGLGYLNLLFMAAELLLLEQDAEQEFPLLLIEEPEAHLHPQLQMKLLQFINRKKKTKDNECGVQCVLSTHSPNISSKADPSEIIALNNGKAWSLRPGETELESEDYLYLHKFLDATKANVFFAKGLLFVEGDAEQILIPELAKLLGRPLEDYGVSVVKCDNAGSWKRFARLFLRASKNEDPQSWTPIKVCVMRDLDLWPACAERKDGEHPYGFKEKKPPNEHGRGGNLDYWLMEDEDAQKQQILDRIESHKRDGVGSLERQNVKIFVSDHWTFEYCLAVSGLFEEACKVLKLPKIEGTPEEKGTYIQAGVSKTDFAYDLAELLHKQLAKQLEAARVGGIRIEEIELKFAQSLRDRLPRYIVTALEHLTAPIPVADGNDGEGANGAAA